MAIKKTSNLYVYKCIFLNTNSYSANAKKNILLILNKRNSEGLQIGN